MYNLRRRLKKAEEKLNLNQKEITFTIVLYGGELPPDRKEAGINLHFELYEKKTIQ